MARKIVMYEIWAPSWPSINEMAKHLERIAPLGITHVWLSGILKSPWDDHGYDVSGYRHIDQRFASGSKKLNVLTEFSWFVQKAHCLGMKVILDLVLNHTSINHWWFRQHPEYYCWSDANRPRWCNLFNEGTAWKYDRNRQQYYLHTFHPHEADLNWFNGDGEINQDLVDEFQKIIMFWKKRSVDGFVLDFPQALNKDLARESMSFEELLFGDKDDRVINALFPDKDNAPFLVMTCHDPTYGDLITHYVDQTAVRYVMNTAVKKAATRDLLKAPHVFWHSEEAYGFMLNTEDHNSPRFTSASGLPASEALWYLLNSSGRAVCLFQGQELGLRNPSVNELPFQKLIELDARTAMRYAIGEDPDSLRRTSRANARVPLPLAKYEQQMQTPNSIYSYTRTLISRYFKL